MTKVYRANFMVNGGTHLISPLEDTNLKRITKEVRNIAIGNMYCDKLNYGYFIVYDEKSKPILVGILSVSKNLRPYVKAISKF